MGRDVRLDNIDLSTPGGEQLIVSKLSHARRSRAIIG